MIVIADAGPLHYLILDEHIDLLPQFFGEVIIPTAVRDELMHPSAPSPVRAWLAAPPPWVQCMAAARTNQSLALGPGEREAIALALELRADLLLVDDKKARHAAERYGIAVAGTLLLLKIAHDRGLLSFPDSVEKLRQSGFRLSSRLVEEIMGSDADQSEDGSPRDDDK